MKTFSDTVKDFTCTIGERNDVDDAVTPLLFTQSILGQQILNPKWSWKSAIFRHILIFSLIVYVMFGTADVLAKATDLTSKGEGYYTILISLIFIVKYCIYANNRETFRKVYLIAKTTLFDIIKATSVQESTDVINNLKIIVKILFCATLSPITIYIFTAIWSNVHGERVTLSKTTSTLMPMTTPYYEIGFVLHTIYLFYMAFSICIIDAWFALVMLFFCVSCDCLVVILEVEPQEEGVSDLEYALRLNDRLRMYYVCHEKLMQYLSILSDLYKWAAVIPLVSVLLATCLLMFLITEQITFTILVNIIPPLIEIFAYNWFGEQLKIKASNLQMALLNFDWASMRLADKRNYLIILTYMQKQFSIKTAFGNELSLNTMADVLKASYQAFTLLKTMDV